MKHDFNFFLVQFLNQFPTVVAVLSCLYLVFLNRKSNETKDSLANIFEGVFTIGLLKAIFYLIPLGVFYVTIWHLEWKYRLFTIPWSWRTAPLYFFGADLWFYCAHRMHHKIPAFWITHGAHHTGNKMTYSLIARGSAFDGIVHNITMMPPFFLGFSAQKFLLFFAIVFTNQALCHTERNWPAFLDKFWITPRLHRIHHGCTPKHINKNFGGFLSIWDALFGTKCSDEEGIKYGLSDGFNSLNPLKITFHLPVQLIMNIWKTQNPKYLFVHYRPAPTLTSENIQNDIVSESLNSSPPYVALKR